MNTFLPSEISRLTYGYLRTHCDQNLADEFSRTCPSMKECSQVKQKYGRNFHATVQDLTLEMMLDQYSRLCSIIFKYFDEDKREYRNVLNLLEIILKKHPEQSCKSDARVLQNVQNVSSQQIESQLIDRRNQSSSKCTEMSDKFTRTPKKTASSIQPTDPEPDVINELLSHTQVEKVSPDRSEKVLRNTDPVVHSSKYENVEAAPARVKLSETTSNVPSSQRTPQKPIPRLIQSEKIEQPVDSSLTNLSEEPNHQSSGSIPVLSIVEEMDEEGNVCFEYSSQSVTRSNVSSRLKHPIETHCPTLAGEGESSVIEENGQLKKPFETTNSQKNPISSSKSTKIVSPDHSVSPPSFVQADWKAVFCDSFKVPTPVKGTSQKMPASGVTSTSKSTSKTIEEVPPQECIQVLLENFSKGFKHRHHPYLSPAKSKGLLQTALSPFSKSYVTPTKLPSSNTAALNHSVASNAASSSSISSSQRSIFSPVDIESPCAKGTPAREESNTNKAEVKPNTKRVSTTEEEKSGKRKKCHRQNPQLSYGVNDEILKKINENSSSENSLNATHDSRPIKNLRKEVVCPKNASQVVAQDADPAKKREKTSRIKKDPRPTIPSSQKSIPKSKNNGNGRKNELKVGKESTRIKEMSHGSVGEIFQKMVLRVFVKDTCEIAELDVSSEFLIYHRNST